jgi:purine-binding chemotaxis protein CheW
VLDIVSLDASQIQPVPRIARGGRVDFLSGLVTVEGAMIALIDLSNLLTQQAGDEAEMNGSDGKAAAQRR